MYPFTHTSKLAHSNGWIPQQYGISVEGIPLIAWWPADNIPKGVFFAAIHGEEAQTLMIAHHMMRTIPAESSHSIIIPVFNPDGVLNGTRQNANGVDLNRNFPSVTWRDEPTPTFPPFTMTRNKEDRNQISSSGPSPGSESEVSAYVELLAEVKPKFMIGLHAPDECILAPADADQDFAHWLAKPAGLSVVQAIPIAGTPVPDPGSSNYWAQENGISAVSYELEINGMPELWERHQAGLIQSITELHPDHI